MQCGVVQFIFKVMDSLLQVFNLCVSAFESGSANVFDCIASEIIKVLISNKIPDLYGSTGVVLGGLGHCFTKLLTVFDSAKFWR